MSIIDIVKKDNKVFVPISKNEFEDAKSKLPKDEFKELFESINNNNEYYRIDTPNDDELSYVVLNSINQNLKTIKNILMFFIVAFVLGATVYMCLALR